MVIVTGSYIRDMRKRIGMSQAALAKLAGVTQAHIAKIEGGRVNPRLNTVNKILAVLKTEKDFTPCRDVMKRNVVSLRPDDPVSKAARLMHKFGISQLPVLDTGAQVGSVMESTIVRNLDKNLRTLKVKDIIDGPFPVVNCNDVADIVLPLLEFHPAVLVYENGRPTGIITRADVVNAGLERKARKRPSDL